MLLETGMQCCKALFVLLRKEVIKLGFWDVLFRSDEGSGSTKVRQDKEDNSRIRADRIQSTGDDKHTHESYNQNTATGSYREYRGGENSPDRSK